MRDGNQVSSTMWFGISPSTVFSELPSKEGGFGILVIVVWMGFCIFIWSMKMVIYYELAVAREKAPACMYVQKKVSMQPI